MNKLNFFENESDYNIGDRGNEEKNDLFYSEKEYYQQQTDTIIQSKNQTSLMYNIPGILVRSILPALLVYISRLSIQNFTDGWSDDSIENLENVMVCLNTFYASGSLISGVESSLPIGKYGHCRLYPKKQLIEFHLKGIEFDGNIDQLFGEIIDDFVILLKNHQNFLKLGFQKIELKSYLLYSKPIYKRFLQILEEKCHENGINLGHDSILKQPDGKNKFIHKIFLMDKFSGKNNYEYAPVEKKGFSIKSVFPTKRGFQKIIGLFGGGISFLKGLYKITFSSNKDEKWKKRIENVASIHINIEKISQNNNS